MSDVMLLGVLRMPDELITGSPISLAQFINRAHEAADRIESDAAIIESLRADLAAANLRADGNAVDAERFRWAISGFRNADSLLAFVFQQSHSLTGDVNVDAVRIDVDAARAAGEKA